MRARYFALPILLISSDAFAQVPYCSNQPSATRVYAVQITNSSQFSYGSCSWTYYYYYKNIKKKPRTFSGSSGPIGANQTVSAGSLNLSNYFPENEGDFSHANCIVICN